MLMSFLAHLFFRLHICRYIHTGVPVSHIVHIYRTKRKLFPVLNKDIRSHERSEGEHEYGTRVPGYGEYQGVPDYHGPGTDAWYLLHLASRRSLCTAGSNFWGQQINPVDLLPGLSKNPDPIIYNILRIN